MSRNYAELLVVSLHVSETPKLVFFRKNEKKKHVEFEEINWGVGWRVNVREERRDISGSTIETDKTATRKVGKLRKLHNAAT